MKLDKSLNATSYKVFNGWNSYVYKDYLDMDIWDPRFTFCRFFLYRLLEKQAYEGTITQEVASSCIQSVNDKFYSENYTSRFIKEGSEKICSSFKSNSTVFLFNKIPYNDFKEVREKAQLWVDFYDEQLPNDDLILNASFIRYARNACTNLIQQYDYDPNGVWSKFVQLYNDVKVFHLERDYFDEMDDLVRDTLMAFTKVYYDMIKDEYYRFETLGVNIDEEAVDTLTVDQIELAELTAMDFIQHPNQMRLNQDKYAEKYSNSDIEEAYKAIYGMEEESVYMKMERCVNRLEDFNEMNAGLCRYRSDVAEEIYYEARIITDLTDEQLSNYIFDFFYLPTVSAADNKEWKRYLENYMVCLTSLRVLYDEGKLTKKDLFTAAQAFNLEVDDMILGVRDEITQECLGDLMEEGEEVTIIEEVENIEGIAVYEEAEDDIPEVKSGTDLTTSIKRMNLGGD